ncbi:MAG: hypothetical protein CM1200mP31_0660 [Candidatus Neomarinimicrobiota bacterium]|nr:MAG: hypothetical protein CM1200mP31_0660 [Candidatus Neomarinimicrobiota bacterium]
MLQIQENQNQLNARCSNDLKRRVFTFNAIAISLVKNEFGTLIDPFNGFSI